MQPRLSRANEEEQEALLWNELDTVSNVLAKESESDVCRICSARGSMTETHEHLVCGECGAIAGPVLLDRLSSGRYLGDRESSLSRSSLSAVAAVTSKFVPVPEKVFDMGTRMEFTGNRTRGAIKVTSTHVALVSTPTGIPSDTIKVAKNLKTDDAVNKRTAEGLEVLKKIHDWTGNQDTLRDCTAMWYALRDIEGNHPPQVYDLESIARAIVYVVSFAHNRLVVPEEFLYRDGYDASAPAPSRKKRIKKPKIIEVKVTNLCLRCQSKGCEDILFEDCPDCKEEKIKMEKPLPPVLPRIPLSPERAFVGQVAKITKKAHFILALLAKRGKSVPGISSLPSKSAYSKALVAFFFRRMNERRASDLASPINPALLRRAMRIVDAFYSANNNNNNNVSGSGKITTPPSLGQRKLFQTYAFACAALNLAKNVYNTKFDKYIKIAGSPRVAEIQSSTIFCGHPGITETAIRSAGWQIVDKVPDYESIEA